MDSAHTDPELRSWLRWAAEGGNAPMSVRTAAGAARMACIPDYLLLRPVLLELKRRYPEPPPGLADLEDIELARSLRWATRGGNVPFFASRVVEAAGEAMINSMVTPDIRVSSRFGQA